MNVLSVILDAVGEARRGCTSGMVEVGQLVADEIVRERTEHYRWNAPVTTELPEFLYGYRLVVPTTMQPSAWRVITAWGQLPE